MIAIAATEITTTNGLPIYIKSANSFNGPDANILACFSHSENWEHFVVGLLLSYENIQYLVEVLFLYIAFVNALSLQNKLPLFSLFSSAKPETPLWSFIIDRM